MWRDLDPGEEGKRFKDEPIGSKVEAFVFSQPGGARRRIQELVARFREKGATTPENAMTAQELGLPPRFEQAMKRRLGATGMFVGVGGKYYLDEARLQQIEQRLGAGAGGATGRQWESRRNMLTLRMARMAVAIATLALVVTNILFVRSEYVSLAVVLLLVLWTALTVVQFYYLSRVRSRLSASGFSTAALVGPPSTALVPSEHTTTRSSTAIMSCNYRTLRT